MIPGNIHTPTTEEIGISGGAGWGVKEPGNSRGEGDWTVNLVSRCPSTSIQYRFKYLSSCSKILSYLLSTIDLSHGKIVT